MRIGTLWRWLALGVTALAPYLHTLGYGFVDFDDQVAIVELPLIRRLTWQTLPDFFAPNVYAGLYEYMPLKNLSYAVDFALIGTSGPALRPQQYLWYVASVLALFAWLRALLRRLAALDRLGVPRTRWHSATAKPCGRTLRTSIRAIRGSTSPRCASFSKATIASE